MVLSARVSRRRTIIGCKRRSHELGSKAFRCWQNYTVQSLFGWELKRLDALCCSLNRLPAAQGLLHHNHIADACSTGFTVQ